MTSPADLYRQLESGRLSYLDRGWECAKLTIPYLLPEDGDDGATDYDTPFQAVGARGVNNLAAALLLALLPPNQAFFRLRVKPEIFAQVEGLEDVRTEIEETLSLIEQEIVAEIERFAYRSAYYEALRQLLVCGNALLMLADKEQPQVYRLDSYVCRRKPNGHPRDVVIHTLVPKEDLPESIRERVAHSPEQDPHDEPSEDLVDLFTHVAWRDKQVTITKEAGGILLDDEKEEMPVEDCPYHPLRWSRVSGEHYGRGLVEDYLGEHQSLEGLQQAVVAGAAAMAKVLFLVHPGGLTDANAIAKAPNLGVRIGRAQDVDVLQVQKTGDLQAATAAGDKIEGRLGRVYLLTEGAIRNAERVTAAEIALIQNQLERQLGGAYSLLALEMQLPLVNLLLRRLGATDRLHGFNQAVEPVVVTGVQALGRAAEAARLKAFVADLQGSIGPELLAQHLHLDEFFGRLAAAEGINRKGLVKTPQEVQAERAAAIQAQAAAQGNAVAAETAGAVVRDQAKAATQPQAA